MKTVLVFRTSVLGKGHIRTLRPLLNQVIDRNGYWNFDLEDCDNILRVETQNVQPHTISTLLKKNGFSCEELH
ncbi:MULTISPECIES: hypothetical protein [Flagellimonas]|uniref:Uncharacterized protein n=1 Tax=Flagellimonas hadalis TaxID=2597517 RepID=A0A5N5IU61_9FLAO|nr:hypothetical protein [Allomuricauda hadalis]KAB5492112.1 hypothetical protein FOT42_003955 [Allomuricauda hadalis]